MCVLDTQEQSVVVKKLSSALQNFAENELYRSWIQKSWWFLCSYEYTPLYQNEQFEREIIQWRLLFFLSLSISTSKPGA